MPYNPLKVVSFHFEQAIAKIEVELGRKINPDEDEEMEEQVDEDDLS